MCFCNNNFGCNQCGCCNCSNKILVRGPQGPTGPTGLAGATGPQGVPGPQGPTGATGIASVSDFGSYYTTAEQTVDNSSFPLTNTLEANNLIINNATGVVTLPTAGFYKIDYGVYAASNATASDYMAIFINGAEVGGTARRL